LDRGGDFVIHGAHKTTVAFTQTAFLHLGREAEARFPGIELAVEEALRAVQTTSPSYILMASMEQAIEVLERDDGAWIDQGTKVALELANRLSKIPGISVAGYDRPLPAGLFHDPSKLLVNLNLSIGGPAAVKYLVQKCKVVPEMTGPGYILLLVSGAHGLKDVDAVEKAFKELSDRYAQSPDQSQSCREAAATVSRAREVPRPTRVMSLREAFLSRAKPLPVEETLGRISADTVVIYPPGSPIITPGERIDQDVVEYILHARKAGLNLLGRGVHGTEGELKVFCVDGS
jgi:arginine/lysine/ornithine decarboxylase